MAEIENKPGLKLKFCTNCKHYRYDNNSQGVFAYRCAHPDVVKPMVDTISGSEWDEPGHCDEFNADGKCKMYERDW